MPLFLADSEGVYRILRIAGKTEIKNHLEKLGFVAGAELSVKINNGGNLIVSIKGSRIALSKEMAGRILVSKII